MDTVSTSFNVLQHVSFLLARQSDQVLYEQLGIGLAQYKILMTLRSNTDVQQRFIAESLGQTEASISRQIKLLQDDGLVQCAKSPVSRREHIVRPTYKGTRITDKAIEVLHNYHNPMYSKLSDKQLAQLMYILNIMHDHACTSVWPRACEHIWAA